MNEPRQHLEPNSHAVLPHLDPIAFNDAGEAVDELCRRYDNATSYLRDQFKQCLNSEAINQKFRAFYPEIRITTESFARIDTRLSFGHVNGPGTYTTTITRPDLFRSYLETQISLLIENHTVSVEIGTSDIPLPLHFAFREGEVIDASASGAAIANIRDIFDTPDLAYMDDDIVNGDVEVTPGQPKALAPFTAPRIDYSLHRLAHYTGTSPHHFQNFVLFTNYQFYVDEFVKFAQRAMEDENSDYDEFVAPGNRITCRDDCADVQANSAPLSRMPQMPTYHLKRTKHSGITLVNIGVGPSNARTITDHIAVLRPHTWIMLGHCAGLRNSQSLGDFVLAHGYVREDHVLDEDVPVSVPIPPLAEVQVALQEAVAEVTGVSGYELKNLMRTGTVATIDNRNWELRDQRGPVKRLSQSRAIALDMESATIATNGFRFRVPYGTLLCVSDKPLHGELKLPGMASEFYRTQVDRHLLIGIRTLEKLRQMPPERLHSRKLRAFDETAFQ
ncbi:MAG: AMP nucleosidase [Pseudomonadota bacterium]